MGSLFGAAVALGVAGLDPTSALIAVAALVAGASRHAVIAFGLTVMIGAPLLGSVLSWTVGSRLTDIDWWALVPGGRVGAIVGGGLGVTLLIIAIARLLRAPATKATKPSKHMAVTPFALIAAGLGYVASLLIDPTFLAMLVLASRASSPTATVALQATWALISQVPLLGLYVAVARLGQRRAAERFQALWSRIKPVVDKVVTAALLAAGLLLIVDAAWWVGTGHFLLDDFTNRS